MPWDPQRYHQFGKERSAPFDDLLAMVNVRNGISAVDLGCGTGELTRKLADALPGSEVVGIDSSRDMLAKAEPHVRPGLRFEESSVEDLGGEWDLIFSNAALHWVSDHHALFPSLLHRLRRDGQLVVQMPANDTAPAHLLILETAAEEPFRTALGGWARQSPILSIEEYAELLYAHGGRDLTVIAKVYPHVLEDADAVADWTTGTTLVPYFERLPTDLHEEFLERYRARLRAHWPHSPVFYGFKRILLSATKPEMS